MIIKGGGAGNVGFWGNHLQEAEKNERAEVVEIKGLAADDLKGALREMQAVAAGSRSQGNFMYQANISPRIEEQLTPEQWREAWDTLEKNMGLEGHQRVIVEHEKGGRVHQHAIWNRVDVDTMKVADIGGNYKIHEQTARQLEKAFDLTPTPTPPAGERRRGRTGRIKRARKGKKTRPLWRECKMHILPRVRLPPREKVKRCARLLTARKGRPIIENKPALMKAGRGGDLSFFELAAAHRANGTLASFLASMGLD